MRVFSSANTIILSLLLLLLLILSGCEALGPKLSTCEPVPDWLLKREPLPDTKLTPQSTVRDVIEDIDVLVEWGQAAQRKLKAIEIFQKPCR